jgi:hypothetical protein
VEWSGWDGREEERRGEERRGEGGGGRDMSEMEWCGVVCSQCSGVV